MIFDLILNEKCNYDCNYCLVKENSNTISIKYLDNIDWFFEFLKKLYSKKLIDDIAIQGGDIGLIDENILMYFFEKINPIKPTISCQKEFFKNNYHILFKDKYKQLFYHVSDLKKLEKLEISDEILSLSKIGIVDSDINKIVDFIKLNEDIYFDYVGFENDLDKEISISEINEINNILYKKIKKLKNVQYKKISVSEKKREACYKSAYITISLAKNKIVSCIRDYYNEVDFTKENLSKVIKNGLVSKKCSNCSRTFQDKISWKSEEKIKTLLILNKI